ncbi:MAG: single-stranded DNA-binding protein [Planctomycetes bacterium]|nr:single-stranded DNA-binding protein [Planctomycetota bacterium]
MMTWIEEGNFFDAVMYGWRVESLEKHLVKGRMIGIEGELEQNRWEDKEGNERSKVVIRIKELQLLPRKE